MTVAHVVERSGVSRRTFYELFEDREDCFLAAFEQALVFASERVLPAYESRGVWRERIRAALGALLVFLDAEPVVGRLLVVESLSGGRATLARRDEVIGLVRGAVDAGRGRAAGAAASSSPAAVPAPLTAEGVVGGVLSVIYARLLAPGGESLVGLLNPLMSMIVLPYLGAGAARRELDRPLPQSTGRRAGGVERLLSDPFKDSGMRLTYRTVRVLMAVADDPGASNRTVGSTAGIEDQGQTSKLLGRLRRIGLVSNTGLGPGQGAPNAWVLTDKGQRVVHAIQGQGHGQGEDSDARGVA